jgi:hypothetical protein
LKQDQQSTINLIHYVQYHLYVLLSKIVEKVNWPFTRYIHECREEIHEQLDIKGLIKRMIFLEYAISYVLEDYHLAEMQLKRPVLPSEIKALREKILAKDALEEVVEEESAKAAIPIYQMDSVVEKESPA